MWYIHIYVRIVWWPFMLWAKFFNLSFFCFILFYLWFSFFCVQCFSCAVCYLLSLFRINQMLSCRAHTSHSSNEKSLWQMMAFAYRNRFVTILMIYRHNSLLSLHSKSTVVANHFFVRSKFIWYVSFWFDSRYAPPPTPQKLIYTPLQQDYNGIQPVRQFNNLTATYQKGIHRFVSIWSLRWDWDLQLACMFRKWQSTGPIVDEQNTFATPKHSNMNFASQLEIFRI